MNERKRRLLIEFVDSTCEECHKKSKDLDAHRINRGINGGEYNLRNIKMLCKKCHKLYHYKEFKK